MNRKPTASEMQIALSIDCPTCYKKAGRWCVGESIHRARLGWPELEIASSLPVEPTIADPSGIGPAGIGLIDTRQKTSRWTEEQTEVAISFRCPVCKAGAGRACKSQSGQPHAARYGMRPSKRQAPERTKEELARGLTKRCSVCRALPGVPCVIRRPEDKIIMHTDRINAGRRKSRAEHQATLDQINASRTREQIEAMCANMRKLKAKKFEERARKDRQDYLHATTLRKAG